MTENLRVKREIQMTEQPEAEGRADLIPFFSELRKGYSSQQYRGLNLHRIIDTFLREFGLAFLVVDLSRFGEG